MSLRVLIVEDESQTAQEMAQWLGESGWSVATASDGAEGLRLACENDFDALVVDRMLPGLDGLSLTAELRARSIETPILFVTAMSAVSDRIEGLDGGGDDYLVKPFALAELKARVHALARRSHKAADATVLQVGGLSLDRLRRAAVRDGQEVELLPLEFKLLETLAMNAGRVVTRAMLLERVWGFHFDPRTNIVESHISRLRRKIDHAGEPSLISHVRGAGYVLAG